MDGYEPRIARLEKRSDEDNRLLGQLIQSNKDILRYVEEIDAELKANIKEFTKHIAESYDWRSRVEKLEELLTRAAKEKLNTTKASQWRIGLVASIATAIVTTVANIYLK